MTIDPRLHRIVAAQPYPLLFATISGAHLYGFPSPDSDYDLRGASRDCGIAARRGRRTGGAGRDGAAGDDCATGHLIRPAATFSPERRRRWRVGDGHRKP